MNNANAWLLMNFKVTDVQLVWVIVGESSLEDVNNRCNFCLVAFSYECRGIID